MTTRALLVASFALPTFAGCSVRIENIDPPPNETLCADFADEAAVAPVTIRIENVGADPIFLRAFECETDVSFSLLDGAGQPLPWRELSCDYTCEELQETSGVCAAGACAAPAIVKLEPGGHHDLAWNGTVLEEREMPDSCYFEPEFSQDSCRQRVVAANGSYAARVEYWLSADGDCEPDGNGACQLPFDASVVGDPLADQAGFSYPDELSVSLSLASPLDQ